MDLDLRNVAAIARRRWWIIVLAMLLAGTAGYVLSSRQTKQYEASATVLVTPGQSPNGPVDFTSVQAVEYLLSIYPQMLTSSDMQQRVANALDMDTLTGTVSASVDDASQMIVVSAVDTDPERAALIANTLVDEFQKYIADRSARSAEAARSDIEAQIDALRDRLDAIDTRISALDTTDNQRDSAIQRQIGDLSQERATINTSLAQLNTQSVTIAAQVSASSPQVEMTEAAFAPTEPFAPSPRKAAIMGAAVGLLLAVGLALTLEFFDTSIKPGRDFWENVGVPLLATVPSIRKLSPGGRQVYVLSEPHSSAAEAMRLLRTTLDFATASSDIRSIAVSSPSQGEGKSTTAANLSVVMAQAGYRTVLIDADLRSASQASIFGIPDESGLTSLLTDEEADWTRVARNVAVPGLRVIPSGPLPPNPSDLVSSARFERLLDEIKEDADLVIIDTPAMLVASDAQAIAAHTDGLVLVAVSHKTRLDLVRHAMEAAYQGGTRVLGVVLNRQKGQHGPSVYGSYFRPVSTPID